MAEIKTVKGEISCTQVERDTRVIIGDVFSIVVPKGMKFSTDQNEIGGDKAFTMFTPVPNLAELGDDSYDMQYGNSQTRVRINSQYNQTESSIDLSDTEIRQRLEEVFLDNLRKVSSMLGEDSDEPFVIRSDDKAIVVANTVGFMGNANFIYVISSGYGTGMYRVAKGADIDDIMDEATPEVYKQTAMRLLSTIESINNDSGEGNANETVTKKTAPKKKTATKAPEEHLGPCAGENGKIDAILTARLFAEDVLFFPETKFERTDNGVSNANLQFNAVKMNEYPFIAQNTQIIWPALQDLFIQLDTNKDLKVPKSKLHPKLLRPLLDDRLTGLSFLNLMAYHMVKIIENGENKNEYLVAVDQNVIAGIPDAYNYIIKFIKKGNSKDPS